MSETELEKHQNGNDIYEYVRRGTHPLHHTERFSTLPTNRRETVAAHTFMVTDLALQFAWEMKKDGRDIDLLGVMLRSHYHDLEEAGTGDIPRWAKRRSDGLKEHLDEAEKEIVKEILSHLDDEVSDDIYEYWENSKDDTIEGQIVKAADILSAIYRVYEEQVLGNTSELFMEDTDKGIDDAIEICEGVPPAEAFLEAMLEDVQRL